MFRYFLLLVCCFTAGSWADTLLFEATYKAKYAGLNITTERRLVQLEDGSYRLESKASNFLGSLTEVSHFVKQEDVWRPLEYIYKRRIFGAKTQEIIAFDWDNLKAHYTHSTKPERNSELRLEPGVLDPALYQLRLQRDLMLNREELEYHFVKRDRVRHYIIQRDTTETLKIKNKSYKAVKMQRINAGDAKQTYVWAVPELDYLFGKIVHVEEDDDSHQMLLITHWINEEVLEQFFASSQVAQQARSSER